MSGTLGGVAIDPLTMGEVVSRCVTAVDARDRLTIGVVNAAKIVNMRRDPGLRDSVLTSDLVLADGQAVVWGARALGHPLPERVAGIDLFTELMAVGAERGFRAYFLGARPEVLAAMLDQVRARYPGLVVAGARDGYFAEADSAEIAAEIAAAEVDLLFLGITSPKKERFIRDWGEFSGARIVHGVGGSFDVLAGLTRRAPARWQRLGLEWLYRLLQEPFRLGPRYLRTNGSFLFLVAREWIKSKGNT